MAASVPVADIAAVPDGYPSSRRPLYSSECLSLRLPERDRCDRCKRHLERVINDANVSVPRRHTHACEKPWDESYKASTLKVKRERDTPVSINVLMRDGQLPRASRGNVLRHRLRIPTQRKVPSLHHRKLLRDSFPRLCHFFLHEICLLQRLHLLLGIRLAWLVTWMLPLKKTSQGRNPTISGSMFVRSRLKQSLLQTARQKFLSRTTRSWRRRK